MNGSKTDPIENSELLERLEGILVKDNGELATWSMNYYRMHRKRYLWDIQLFKRLYNGGEVLELGSAPFHLTWLLKESGAPITAVDIDPSRQETFLKESGIRAVKCNIETERLPFADHSFKYILFNEIFEHLRINPIKTLKEVQRVLHKDGVLVLSTPNLYGVRNVVNLVLGKGFDSPYEQFSKLETIGHMGHVREYSVKQVKEFLENTGFKVEEVMRVSHTPLRGLWTPFNLVRRVFPRYHRFQVHVCSVNE